MLNLGFASYLSSYHILLHFKFLIYRNKLYKSDEDITLCKSHPRAIHAPHYHVPVISKPSAVLNTCKTACCL